MQNRKNQEIQERADDFLEELTRCEKIFKTRPCLEILAPIENRKSRVDDVKFRKISRGILKQLALMENMEVKLSEMGTSLKSAKDLIAEMNLKYDNMQK